MNLGQLLATFRRRADDTATVATLWADSDIIDMLNQAEAEAAERGRLILDRTTPATCQVAIVVNQTDYVLDTRVFDVYSARVRGEHHDLFIRSDDELLRGRGYDPGVAKHFALYLQGDIIHLLLDRAPLVVGTLDLAVYRRPLNTMDDPGDVPEIEHSRHVDLIYWALFLAYDTRDADAGDPAKAQINYDRFEQVFGPKIDANVRRKQLKHRPPVTRPHY
ncbi:MAG: hypothetical protein V4641_05620 [Pseudomonadota bacterium]